MKIFLFSILVGFAAAPVWADDGQTASAKIIPNTAVLIPQNKNINAKWDIPPIQDLALSEWATYRFRLDAEDNIWLFKTKNILMCPSNGVVVNVDKSMDDYLWLHNDDLLITSQGDLGYITASKAGTEGFPCVFHSVLNLPVSPAHLSLAGSNGFFIWGSDKKSGNMCVYRFEKSQSKKNKPIQLLFTTDKTITAVGGDASHLFVAIDSLIVQVRDKNIIGILSLKGVRVRDLVYQKGTGLFYASDTGVGLVDLPHEKRLKFIESPGADVALGSNDDLFVKFDAASGILKIDGISYFNPSHISDKDKK